MLVLGSRTGSRTPFMGRKMSSARVEWREYAGLKITAPPQPHASDVTATPAARL